MQDVGDDRAGATRVGEELPIASLASYLVTELPELRDDFAGEIVVAQFGRGYSNLTYLLRIGERELVLRRPPVGANIATAHDMSREARVLTGVARVYDLVPRVLVHCQNAHIIGAPFYIMERLHGVVLRADDPQRPPIAPEIMSSLATNVINNLAAIHALDYHAAGLADLGKPAGYLTRQVNGWTKRYHAAQTTPQPDLEAALRWLATHQPAESGAANSPALIHNDYKHDNLMLNRDDLTQIIAVLDWEMCTLGDPLLDLGTTLGYWLEANDPPALLEMFGLTALPGNPSRAEVVERYVAASGRPPFDPLFYYVYGLAKIGVILQQIYYRYQQGQSQDQRFARLGGAVDACGLMARAAIGTGRISGLF